MRLLSAYTYVDNPRLCSLFLRPNNVFQIHIYRDSNSLAISGCLRTPQEIDELINTGVFRWVEPYEK